MSLDRELRERIAALGFARVGVAHARLLEPEAERLRHWLDQGRHGSMSWMADTAEVRVDPRHERMLPTARSIVVAAAPYGRADRRVGPAPGRVARYAWGRDYHNVLHKKLRRVAGWLREVGHDARVSVDSMPVFERAWAQRAGVGFVGKNCCVIVPGIGSHVFLAAIVTSAELTADEPMAERCGSCRLCLDGCPTRAFENARELDARRCISYLTIEHAGPIDESLRAGVGDWIFGCDACQDVCPFNRGEGEPAELAPAFSAHDRFDQLDAAALLALDDAQFEAWAAGSPLRRAGRRSIARNAALVLGNSGERRHLPVLQRAASEHDDETVRQTARWACDQLSSGGSTAS